MNKDTYPAPLVGALAGKAMPLDVLTGILGLIEQGVVIAGRDRRIVYVNAAFSRLCGYDPAEILGKTCKFLQGPATDQETVVRLRDSLDRGIAFKGTILNYRKNDEAFWNELCITPIRDETGDIDYYVGLQRDISVVAKSGIEVLAENGPDHFLLDHMLAGLVVHAPDTTIVYANATAERLLRIAPGHSLGALNTDPRWRFLREDGSPMPIEEYPINQAVATRADIKNLILGIRNTEGGDCNWLMCNAYPELDGAGQPIRVIVSFTDITDLKQAERSLKQSEERLQLVLRGSQDASWDWDLVQNQVYYSPRWWQMLGCEDAALPAPPSLWRTLVHPDDADITLDRFGAILKGNDESYELEFRLRHQDGHFVPILSRGFILRDDAGRPLRISGTNTDLTERKRTEEQIHTLAFYDPLTNLANRRLLTAQLRRALLASERTGLFGAVLFIDLDNFKWLNDTLGHDMGDKLLQEVSLRLKQTVRQSDVIARLGGDEFLVMVENLHGSPRLAAVEAEHLGTKILTALRQSYSLDNSRHFSTPSIGVALFGPTHLSVEALLRQADLAMYQAKEEGRNRLRFFDASLQEAVDHRVALEKELRDAIDRNEMCLLAQPQVREDGAILGAELLVRWHHPQRGLVSPADFIPLAETTGLILPLGAWVLNTCCRLLSDWAHDPALSRLSLSVNISVKQFREPDFDQQVLAAITRSGADPSRLKLELTESLLAENVEDVIAKMTRLRAHGIEFSLDDFGTGYSSLSYLQRMPLDQLKIDRSFIRDVTTSQNDAAIARVIIALAERLSLDVIAEGVETMEQRQFLIDNGCHIFQGYLLGRPMEIGALESLCRAPPI